jgi:hypothetical protein
LAPEHAREVSLIVKACLQSDVCERAFRLTKAGTREINSLAPQIRAHCHSGELSKDARQMRGVNAG